MKYTITENAINGVEINEKIRDEELHEYYIINRLDFIDELINWIAEARDHNRVLMTDDLKMLINTKDEFLFSSNSTNSYVGSEDAEFETICKELLELNNSL